jgi:peroxiredoxin Q/BCP
MATELKAGRKAPDFTLTAGDGTRVRLSSFRGKKVVLYFYPRDNTPGCTREACDFRDAGAKLRRRGAVVLGVSPDTVESHERFRDRYDLNFPLLADVDRKVVSKYGVWQEKTLYGKKSMGVVRTTFVIDEDGEILRVFPKVRVDGHIDQVLEALEG